MKFEFVAAKDNSVLDRVTLTNRLRQQHKCKFCYSRTGGRAPSVVHTPAACSPPESTADLEALYRERQSAEGVEWRAPDAETDVDDLLSIAVGDGDGLALRLGVDMLEDIGVEEELEVEDMHGADAEMDAQSDDGNGPEEPGYTQEYVSAEAKAFS
jgi:hypothetical protein